MEKWKGIVIMLLLGGLGGYGAWQQKQARDAANTPFVVRPIKDPSKIPANIAIQAFVGKPLPAWNIAPKFWMNSAKALNPTDFKGHVTIVEFFRIKCSHCQDAAPVMEAMSQQLAPQGLKVVGIHAPSDKDAQENDWNLVASVCKTQFGLTYPVAFDEKSKLFKGVYRGQLYPSVFVLNREGIVVFAQTGFDELHEARLRSVVKKELAKKESSTR